MLNSGGCLNTDTWVRYDEDRDVLSRIDSTVSATTKYLKLTGRYYKVNAPTGTVNLTGAPQEEISGGITVTPFGGWSVGYLAVRDLDDDVTRSQQATIGYKDDCTLIELFYTKRDFDNDLIRNDSEFGIRLTLSTLGSFGGN